MRTLLARTRLWVATTAVVLAGVTPSTARGQQSTAFQACTTGLVGNCSVVQLSAWNGAGPGGATLFSVFLHNLGSQSSAIPTSIYNLVFATGGVPAPGAEVDTLIAPNAIGGATILDGTSWSLYDAGDVVFLSSLTNAGVGGCVSGGPVLGWGQAAQTCGVGQFVQFSFYATHAYDPRLFTLLDYEVVALTPSLDADSCGLSGSPCAISPAPFATLPEPRTVLMVAAGLLLCGVRMVGRATTWR